MSAALPVNRNQMMIEFEKMILLSLLLEKQ
jgi:hypothetical protein